MHEKMGTNVAYERTFSFGEVDQAFAERRPHACRPSSTGRARPACRWTRTARSRDYDRGTGVLTIYGNSMNFTYFLWLYRDDAEDPGEQAQLVPVAAGGSFGSKFFMHKVPTFAALPRDDRRAAR